MAQHFASDPPVDGQDWPRRAPNNHLLPDFPSGDFARVVLQIDATITQRRTAAASLTARGKDVPSLPVKPTRMELALPRVLGETCGTAPNTDSRFAPVIECIAEHDGMPLVQRVMSGESEASATPGVTDADLTGWAGHSARLAGAVREARTGLESLCATWPNVYFAQSHAALEKIGVRVRPTTDRAASPDGGRRRGSDETEGRGGHAGNGPGADSSRDSHGPDGEGRP